MTDQAQLDQVQGQHSDLSEVSEDAVDVETVDVVYELPMPLAEGELEEPEEEAHSPTKSKRPKIDKDGFVTPATPDIPKTSLFYTETHNTSQGSTSSGMMLMQESPLCGEQSKSAGKAEHQYYGASNSAGGDVSGEDNILEAAKPLKTVSDLLKELSQESKMVNSRWSQVLSESENVEMFCPTRLDKILEEALALEEHLKSQKERLRQRLQALSRTLQLI